MCMHKGELANINPPRITTEPEETMEPPVLPAQQENIEREAVDMLEGITALMTGYNEVHDIIPTI